MCFAGQPVVSVRKKEGDVSSMVKSMFYRASLRPVRHQRAILMTVGLLGSFYLGRATAGAISDER